MPYKDPEKRSEYNKKYNKEWYKKNKTKHLINCRVQAKKNKKRNRDWLREYKADLACSICPEKHPATLVFHHLVPSEKDHNVSKMIGDGHSIKRILTEIKKCKVLCHNCHAKFHWIENE